MSGPKLLLLDEPSAGLAPVVVQSIFALVKRICAEGYTVLIVEQNVQQVLKVVDRAYLLETGRIKSSGEAAALAASGDSSAPTSGSSDGRLRHLPSRGGGERHPARRAARAALARPESHLRRHRRGLDLLRRAHHDRHVRGIRAAHAAWLAAACRHAAASPSSPRSARRCTSSSSARCSPPSRSTNCSLPAACFSCCRPWRRSPSASIFGTSACACSRSWSARCRSPRRASSPSSRRSAGWAPPGCSSRAPTSARRSEPSARTAPSCRSWASTRPCIRHHLGIGRRARRAGRLPAGAAI